MENIVSTLRTLTLEEVTGAQPVNEQIRLTVPPRQGLVMDARRVEPNVVTYWARTQGANEILYMTPYGKSSALNYLAPENNPVQPAVPQHATYREETPFRMARADTLLAKWQQDAHHYRGAYQTYTESDGVDRFQVNLFCIPLLRLPGFYENLKEYQEFPDEGIRISDGVTRPNQAVNRPATQDDVDAANAHNANAQNQQVLVPVIGTVYTFHEDVFISDVDNQWDAALAAAAAPANALAKTGNEWEYIAFTNVYSFSKTPGGDTEQQRIARYRQNLIKRLNALKATKADRSLQADEFIATHLNLRQVMRHFDDLSFYPRLKCMILRTLMTSQDPICANLKMLLSEHQMTVFCAIAAFIETRELTVLHVIPEVSKHYPQFVRTIAGLRAKFGSDGWKYVKLLDPLNQITSGQQFSELGNAARAWVAAQPGSESFKNLANKAQIPFTYKLFARRPLPAEMVAQGVNMMDNIRNYLQEIGFTIVMEQFTPAAWANLVATTPEQLARLREQLAAGHDV